jgi:hypothetical protein
MAFYLHDGKKTGLYGKGYPRGKKMAACPAGGLPPKGRLGGGPPAGHIRVGHGGPP